MALNFYSTAPSGCARESCASILAVLIFSFLIALVVWGTITADPVTSGHAYAVEAVR